MADAAADPLVLLARAFELQQAGRLADAEAAYATLLARTPDDPTALVNAGALAFARGDYPLAVARFERVVRRAPAHALALANLGMALVHAGRDADALAALDRAIAANPALAQAHNNRGIALARMGRASDAIAAFDRALTLAPRYLEAALNLGEQCNAAGDAARAHAAFDRALAIDANHVGARTGRAFAQALAGDLPGAIEGLAAITAAHPANAGAWQTEGAVRNWAWDHDGAERAYRASLRAKPDNAEAAFGVAATLLARGRYDEGWAAFEQRPDRTIAPGTAVAALPVWDGEPFAGTLVVCGEQGFGDVLQFARFVAAARTRVTRVVLLLDGYRAPLAPLLATLPGSDQVATRPADVRIEGPAARVSLLSLPHRLRIGRDAISAAGRYLAPPDARAAAWRDRMRDVAPPRVGLAWSVLARAQHGFVTRHKSVPAAVLAPLVATPGISFVTLQPGVAGDPAAFGAQAARIVDLRAHLSDFADTAALIDTLDLVVCGDTAVAHLAGALGKPVWMLDRFHSCWRWRNEAGAAVWYPSLTVFRQDRFGDWDGVARRLADAFAAWHAARLSGAGPSC